MKVRARHWLKYNGVWYRGGDEFEIPTTDADEMGESVEIAETPLRDVGEAVSAEKPKRGRKKQSEG